MLPVDVVVADSFSEEAACATVDVESIPAGWRIMDIGPRTAEAFEEELGRCRTVVWNGPMGVFEWEPFANGTTRVGMALARLGNAVTVVGGGSTAEAVERLGIADRMTHVSTGGGASLELLEGRVLPGVAALLDVS
jgi:phosphoglycerate kinase